MRFSINANRGIYFGFIAILMVGVLLFPITHSGDGWGYAADTLEFEGNIKSLLSPHHLLYTPWCSFWLPIIRFFHIEPIAGFTCINFILCVLTLEVLRLWLLKLNTAASTAQLLIWFLLGSFGLLRFAFDNETYIVPLFMALWGSYRIEIQKDKNSILGWISLAFAVLFHQSYIFWFIAYAISNFRKAQWIFPVLSGGIILLAYLLAAYSSNESIGNYIVHDVNQGLVDTQIGPMNFLFTAVNLVRTIIQIHGSILFIISDWRLLSIMGFLGLFLLFISFLAFIWTQRSHRRNQTTKTHIFKGTLSWVFFLQLGFAFYSVGNAEFMVMLLPLAILLMAKAGLFSSNEKTVKPLMGITIGTWVYNLVFALIPLFLGSNSDAERLAEILNQNIPTNNTKKIVLISNEAKSIENAWEYIARTNGKDATNNILFNLGSSEKDIQELKYLSKDPHVDLLIHNTFVLSSMHSRATAGKNPLLERWISEQQWEPWQTTHIESPRREISLLRLRK
jgi:hypothetical protein